MAILAYLFSVLDWRIVIEELSHLNYLYLIPITIAFFGNFALRAVRWRYLLPEGQNLSFSLLFDSLMIGNLATFILPLRAGEFIRPYVLSKEHGTFSTAFSSVVIERFFDLAFVLLLFALVLASNEALPNWVTKGAFLLCGVALVTFCFMVAGSFLPKFILNLADFFTSIFPERHREAITNTLKNFLEGASILKRRGNFIKALALTVAVWFTCFLTFQIGFALFSLSLPNIAGIAVMVILALAVAAPSAPGFLGIFQTACIASLALFDINKETALAYSLIMHAHQYVCICGYGVYALSKRHLSIFQLKEGMAT